MLAALLPLLFPFAARAATTGVPDEAWPRVEALGKELARERQGRLLLAETVSVPRLATRNAAQAVSYQRRPAAVVFDFDRLAGEAQWDAELSYARALALASQRLSVELAESDEKAWADTLEWALEKAQDDQAFGERFKAAVRAQAADPGAAVVGEVDRAARYAARLLESVDSFCAAVEAGRPWSDNAVTLTALSDFVERYGPGYEALSVSDASPYARAGERRYPASLYLAARDLEPSGSLAPVREALGPLETRTLPDLRRRLERLR